MLRRSRRRIAIPKSFTTRRTRLNQGFTLPLIIGITLVVSVLSMILLITSQGDRVSASSQVIRTNSMAVAETGAARTLSLLKGMPELSRQDLGNWKTTYDGIASPSTPGIKTTFNNDLISKTQATVGLSQRWISLGAANQGEFRIVDYTHDSAGNLGTLDVEGRARVEGNVSNRSMDISNSVAALRITIPTNQTVSFGLGAIPNYPTLWVGSTGISGQLQDVGAINNGKVLFIIPPSGGTPTAPRYVQILNEPPASDRTKDIDFSKVPPLVRASISNGALDNRADHARDGNPVSIDYSESGFPPLPAMPAATNLNVVGPIATTVSDPMNQVFSFPRSGDKAIGGRYHYLIQANASGNSIDFNAQNTQLEITDQVTFYLQGNINFANNSKLMCQGGCVSGNGTDFQMYGSQPGTFYRAPGDTSTQTTQRIVIGSNSTFNADFFLFAPNAEIDLTANGSASNSNTGVTWVKGIVGMSGNKYTNQGNNSVVVTVTVDGQTIKTRTMSEPAIAKLPPELRGGTASCTTPTGTGTCTLPPGASSPQRSIGPVRDWMQQQTRPS